MTFNARENSLDNGQPVRLYVFAIGTQIWRYCNVDRDVTYGGNIYQTLYGGMGDAGIIISGDPNADTLEITAPADLPVAGLFRGFPPTEEVTLQIFDAHYGDAEFILAWSGRITTVRWSALDRCNIACINFRADLNVPGLTDTYTRFCTVVLGDARCKVNLVSLQVVVPVATLTLNTATAPELAAAPANFFTAGHVAWVESNGVISRRHIETHTGDTVTLLGGTQGMPSTNLTFFPGCDFLPETCQNKFNNIANFRGIPQLQGESPFDGNQVF